MLVTIAIINYNYGRFLEQAIKSALVQGAPDTNVEILIIDDGSTDNSDAVLAEFPGDRGLRILKTVNSGFGASLGKAIKEARGEWVMLLDADDWFESDKLERVRPFLVSEKAVIRNFNKFVDESGRHSGKTGAPGNTSTLTVRREYALDILPVDDESGFHILEICGYGSLIAEALTNHRIHGASMAANAQKEFLQRKMRYRNMADKLRAWNEKRPSWISERDRRRSVRIFEGMSSFAGMESEICLGRRGRAFCTAIRTALITKNVGSAIRALARVAILRSLPTREKLFL